MIFNILIVLSVFYNQHLTNFIIINKSYVSFSVGCVRCRVSRTTGPRGWGGRLGGAGAEGASGADTATLARERPPAPRSASWNLGGRAAPRGRQRLSGVVPMQLAEQVSASCGDSAARRPRWAWERVCGRRGAGNRSGLPERPAVRRRGSAGSGSPPARCPGPSTTVASPLPCRAARHGPASRKAFVHVGAWPARAPQAAAARLTPAFLPAPALAP